MSKKSRRLENRAKNAGKLPVTSSEVAEQKATPIAVTPPPQKITAKKEETLGRGEGYIIEIASDNDKVLYWKVITPHPTEAGNFATALAYKPTIKSSVGSKIKLDLVPYFNKWSATNVAVIEEVTDMTPYLEQIASVTTEVPEGSNGLFPSQIVGMLLKTPHRTGNLCSDLKFKQIVGRVQGGSKIQFV